MDHKFELTSLGFGRKLLNEGDTEIIVEGGRHPDLQGGVETL